MRFRQKTFTALALILLAHGAFAQERQFGAWAAGVNNGKTAVYAGTTNESQGIFAQYCQTADGNCYWVLVNDIECEVGSKYTIFVNADIGASTHETQCMKVDGKPRYTFYSFDEITAITLKSSKIAFAFPIGDSQFKVSRFSLSGSNEALDLMAKTGHQVMQKNKGKGTRDQML